MLTSRGRGGGVVVVLGFAGWVLFTLCSIVLISHHHSHHSSAANVQAKLLWNTAGQQQQQELGRTNATSNRGSIEFIPFKSRWAEFMAMSVAYLDVRPMQVRKPPKIRIVGMAPAPRLQLRGLSCVWTNSSDPQREILSDLSQYVAPDHHNTAWVVVMLSCTLPANADPVKVAIVSTVECQKETSWIEVRSSNSKVLQMIRNGSAVVNSTYSTAFDHQLAVCVPPVFGDRYDTSFVQWMEFYKLMGATKFFVYDFQASESLREWFSLYEKDTILEVIQYPLPTCNDLEAFNLSLGKFNCSALDRSLNGSYGYIHYFAQLASMNECMLRSLGLARWTVFIDLDEFLIPRLHKNLSQYFERTLAALKIDGGDLLGFQFSNFYSEPCSVPISDELSESGATRLGELVTGPLKDFYTVAFHQAREPPHWGFQRRSKNVVNTLLTEVVGIHDFTGVFFHRPSKPQVYHNLIYANSISARYFKNASLTQGWVTGKHSKQVLYVNPSEATMFHLRDFKMKLHEDPFCQSLYRSNNNGSEEFVQDSAIWKSAGIELVNCITIKLKQLLSPLS